MDNMLTEVDFKWLMTGEGCWIDTTKLHTDPQYAHACIQSALQSNCVPLRCCAVNLQHELAGLN
jgi:hypothetical protein